jgi:GNAT superfamily N-acetyltransferase
MSGFIVTDDRAAMDVAVIHHYLSEVSYWARGITYDKVVKSLDNALCFGGFVDGRQVAFARVVTDRTTFAYLCDVFVLDAHRGQGYSKALMAAIMAHPDLQGLRRFYLGTLDAHSLYAQFGFKPVARPERLMEINNLVISDRV